MLMLTANLGSYYLPVGLLVAAVVLYLAITTYLKAQRTMLELGIAPRTRRPSYALVFLVMVAVAVAVAWGLKLAWDSGAAVVNTLTLVAFPYIALFIFLIGSIYRYINRGFQVSSLSSEFLERKKLFWGSQPFHYGLMWLFFGHLTAFLFPRSVLAWNGEPVRLLILEMSAFAFGLATLLGLVLLIRRRLGSRKVMMVTNRMDMLVYVVLLVQILSGLIVAVANNWGTSWFASAITPYMRSIFAFNPDVAAVSALPWTVKMHMFSAFFIIAIIPFTRFIHFLVAPIDYIWRGYQVVIWNWSRKAIRSSGSYFPGKKGMNH
ncbi:MAG: respiratory nitrate reductase subunit gamma [Flavobacteriales bacterium]|nr:respiratory nitrate reductase subunit gamma [Flavobacteriales bacterium]